MTIAERQKVHNAAEILHCQVQYIRRAIATGDWCSLARAVETARECVVVIECHHAKHAPARLPSCV